jgi:hypothetical protein
MQTGENLYLIRLDAIEKAIGEVVKTGPPRFTASAGELARVVFQTRQKVPIGGHEARNDMRDVCLVPFHDFGNLRMNVGGLTGLPSAETLL